MEEEIKTSVEYEILETIEEKTVKTLVKYPNMEAVWVSHFNPTEKDVERGIQNRYSVMLQDIENARTEVEAEKAEEVLEEVIKE